MERVGDSAGNGCFISKACSFISYAEIICNSYVAAKMLRVPWKWESKYMREFTGTSALMRHRRIHTEMRFPVFPHWGSMRICTFQQWKVEPQGRTWSSLLPSWRSRWRCESPARLFSPPVIHHQWTNTDHSVITLITVSRLAGSGDKSPAHVLLARLVLCLS